MFPSWVLNRIQKPLNSVRNQKPGQILTQVLGLVGAGREALQVGAVRDDRGGQVHVEEHAEEAEQAPHPRSDRRARSASTRASAPGSAAWPETPCRRARAGSAWPPTALGIAPTLAPMPKPLSRIQLVTVRLPMPPEPAVAASAPMSAPVDRLRQAGEAEEAPEGLPPVRQRHERDVDDEQEQEHDAEHRPGEVLEHPLDGAAEREDQDDERGSAPTAIQPCAA